MARPSLDDIFNTPAPVQQNKPSLDEIFQGTPVAPVEDKTVSPFEAQLTKGLYEHVPFGKRIIKSLPGGEETAKKIEAVPNPVGFAQDAGRIIGGGLGLAPAFEVGAAGAVGNGAKFVAGSLGLGGQAVAEAETAGKKPLEAFKEGAETTGASLIGGKILGKASAIIKNRVGIPQELTQKSFDDLINKHASTYREILNPGKGVIQKVEIKSGKDLDDAFKLAAKEGVIVGRDQAGKIDTTGAIKQLEPKVKDINDQLTKILSQDNQARFDLNDLAYQVKQKLNKNIKNALDLKNAKAHVDQEISAEVERNGQMVGGATLNRIKQGMWSKSYDPLAPNKNVVARQIGVAAKDAIEKMYPMKDVQGLNQELGKYYDLKNILENAHGNVVQKGKIGQYAAQAVGALSGHATGVPGAEIAGSFVGGKLSKFLNDPQRITEILSNRLKGLKITDPNTPNISRPGTVIPEVLNTPPAKRFPENPIGLPVSKAPLGLPNIFSDRASTPPVENVIRMGQENAPGVAVPDVYGEQYTPGSSAIINERPNNPLGKWTSILDHFPTNEAKIYHIAKLDIPNSTKGRLIEHYKLNENLSKGDQSILNNPLDKFNPIKKINGLSTNTGNKVVHGIIAGGALAGGLAMNPGNAQAANNIDMNKIYQIESSGNPNAYNRTSGARGLGQITPIVLKEWNNMNPKNKYTTNALNDKVVNMKISDWYMNKRIPQMLKAKGLQDTIKNRLIAYNAGIGHVGKSILPKETFNYIQKYQQS